jgi:tetratricopeptide (TPR) repeat protein/transcriptional regulator with XRE-family HTH domain
MTLTEEPGPFGELLRRCRSQSGLTQEELAERAEISPRTVGDLERGAQLRPYPGTVRRLAEALDLSEQDRKRLLRAASGGRTALASPRVPVDNSLDRGSPLVGRGREQAALERHLTADGSPLLLFAGEPGIGKTRLLEEAMRQASEKDMAILSGGCDRRSGQDPYSPMTEVLQKQISKQTQAERAAGLEGAEWLVRLLPELDGVVETPRLLGALAPEQERRLVFDSVSTFLAGCATPSGLLLVLDDLQWAGVDGLDLLLNVLRRAHASSLHVVGVYRDTEVDRDHPLSSMLADLARYRLATIVPIGELSDEAASELLQHLVHDDASFNADSMKGIVEQSEGVPFFLVSYAEGLRSGAYKQSEPAELPWSVARGVRQRVAALPPSTQNLLAAAAIVGRESAPSLLAAVVKRSEEQVLIDLGLAWRAGLMKERGERTYQFSHDVIRDVVETDLEPPRRVLLHRRVAEALEQLPERRRERTPGALASHFLEGNLAERALPYALLAGREAFLSFAPTEAESHYRMALKLAQVLSNPAREAEAGVSLGDVLVGAGRWQEARSVLMEAMNKYRELGDLDGEARVAGSMTAVNETPQEGLERLQPLLERIERCGPLEGFPSLTVAEYYAALDLYPAQDGGDGEPGACSPGSRSRVYPWLYYCPGLGWLYEGLAYLLDVAGRHDEALAAAERAVAIGQQRGNKWLQRAAENLYARSLIELGRVDEGLAQLETTIALPVKHSAARSVAEHDDVYRSDTVSFPDLQNAFSFAAQAYASKGDLARAKTYVVRALSLSEEYGEIIAIARALGEVAYVSSLRCEWSQVAAYLDRLEVILSTADVQWDRPKELHLLVRGHLHLARGEWEQCCESIHQGMALRERRGETATLPLFHEALAELELMRGNAGLAQSSLEAVLARGDVSERHKTSLTVLLAWAHLERGDSTVVRDLAESAADQARNHGTHLYLADALWVRGLAESRLGLAMEAGHSLEAALELARSLNYGRGEGRALCAQGLADLERGDLQGAKDRLRAALIVFQSLELQPYVFKTQRVLSRLA